jgi:hypothetical protein
MFVKGNKVGLNIHFPEFACFSGLIGYGGRGTVYP